MAEKGLTFEGFAESVDPRYQDFVRSLHASLLDGGCKLKLQTAKTGGYVVSYQHGKDKRVLLNFVFRKSGMLSRIYADNIGRYGEFLSTLPDKMAKSIEKAAACRMCNERCSKGYAFALGGNEYSKCRYNCFLFAVDDESIPFIHTFLDNEVRERNA